MNRTIDFNDIRESLGDSVFYSNEMATIAFGDSLSLLKNAGSQRIPYFNRSAIS